MSLKSISVIHEGQILYTNVMNVNYQSPKKISKLNFVVNYFKIH